MPPSKRAAPAPAPANSSSNPKSKRPRTAAASTSLPAPATLKFKSPAEFFAENKNIAGFDNPGKSLYTTIRELVENALDAAESIHNLPDVSLHIQRIPPHRFRSMLGMDAAPHRVDHSLYKRPPIPEQTTTKNSNLNNNINNPDSHSRPRHTANHVFRVTVQDNGCGMAHDDVPNMMARVLAGTKYCVRQARGKFGLGSKMALIWAKMSTGLPLCVTTSASPSAPITHCVLDIDITNNRPTVISHTKSPNPKTWRGSKVSVTIQGNWTTYRSKILAYMRQMAVITPYAQFHLIFQSNVDAADSKDLEAIFSRRTDHMPPPAREVKHHPSSVNQLILKQLLGLVKPSTTLVHFLSTQLDSIPRSLAVRLINELGPDFTSHMTVSQLQLNHIRQIDALLHAARFDKPNGSCLSPAGEYNLRLGITKELKPTLVATHAEHADVFEGHPFIVEAGVALGGSGMKPGINVYRFANRIPLLFEAGNDVVTKTARDSIRWNNYKISPTTDRIGVICSIVSTKIPFKGTGKEYIGDDSDVIKASVKRAITQCCLQLKTKLVRRAAQKDAAERKKTITKYAPGVAKALVDLFSQVDNADASTRDVVDKVQSGEITKETLLNKLLEHVQQIDKEQAIEYASATGRDHKKTEMVYLAPRAGQEAYLNLWQQRSTKGKHDDKASVSSTVRLSLLKALQVSV